MRVTGAYRRVCRGPLPRQRRLERGARVNKIMHTETMQAVRPGDAGSVGGAQRAAAIESALQSMTLSDLPAFFNRLAQLLAAEDRDGFEVMARGLVAQSAHPLGVPAIPQPATPERRLNLDLLFAGLCSG